MICNRREIILLLLLALIGFTFTVPVKSQDISNIKFTHLTRSSGLPDHNIQSIFKDSDGFMWFGTRNGLCRFDGTRIITFRSDGSENSLAGNRILSITEDREGFLWIGTYAGGLSRMDRKARTFRNYGLEDGIGMRVNRVKTFGDGSLWVCSNIGLARYLPATDGFDGFYHDPDNPDGLNFFSVFDIILTRKDRLFVATEANDIQELHLSERRFSSISYARDPALRVNYNKRLVEGPDGSIYICANQHGLATYHPETETSSLVVAGPSGLSTNILSGDMAFDHEGRLWICTDGGGVDIFHPETGSFTYISADKDNPVSLASNHVYSIYFDDENRAWIGTFDRGISIFDENHFKFSSTLFDTDDLKQLDGKSVLTLFQDSKDQIWIGTDGDGLYRFNPSGGTQIYLHDPLNQNSLTTNVVTSLGEGPKGHLLIGTYIGGLLSYHIESDRFTSYFPSESANGQISSSSIWKIKRDSKQRIWLGLLGQGVDLFDPLEGTFENYGPFSSRVEKIDFQNTMDISEDTDGDIWFGTEGGGIYILDSQTDKVKRYDHKELFEYFISSHVKSIYQDRNNLMWIGTEGQGLIQFNKTSYELKVYSTGDGLPGNIIQSIAEDRFFNLWIGTNNGISLLNRSTGKMINFLTQDGLSGNEFNQGALLRLSDGRILAGTKNGADIISSDQIILNQNLPRIVFSELSILGREVEVGDTVNRRVVLEKDIAFMRNLNLKYEDKGFSLGFTALNYTLPEKCIYRYRLEGFEEEWITVSSRRRVASYANLRPGRYVFQVEASNNDGKWGNNREEMVIQISAPFYRTTWFLASVVVLILGLIFILYRLRMQYLKHQFSKQQIEQERRIVELENEKLERELQTLSVQQINRNRILLDQKKRLSGLSLKARESVKQGLEKIIEEIDRELQDDKDWKFIEPQIDKVYNNFISRLKETHHDLSLQEIKLAAYVRMGLSTKEISEFMQKTNRGIESDRYRLRKKLGLETNDSLSKYLLKL